MKEAKANFENGSMKQNEGYQDFDKQVQQLLGQASEPVPEGAWEAIAARLAAGAGAVGAGANAAETVAAAEANATSGAAGTAGAGAGAGARKAVILKWVRRGGFAIAGVAAAVLLAVLLWNRPEETTDNQLAVVTEQTQDETLAAIPEPIAASPEYSTVHHEQRAVSAEQSTVHHEQRAVSPEQSAGQASTAPSTPISGRSASEQNAIAASDTTSGQSTIAASSTTSGQSNAAAQGIAIAAQGAVLARAETQATGTQAKSQAMEVRTDSRTAESQSSPRSTEPQAEFQPTEVSTVPQPAQAQAEPQIAEAEVQPIDWEHLPDWEEEAQARSHKKYQPNGFHLAAYTNALSNFTSKKSGQYSGYSGASGINIPDHSYFRETGESNYTIPLTFGINFTYDVLPKLSVGLGVNYTRLSRHFSATYYQLQPNGEFDAGTDYDNVYNIQQFIGIPLSVYYHIVRTKHINFYVYANGTVEKCIGNAWTANNRAVNYNEPVKGVQFNAGAGLGVDFMLAPLVSIYLDPNVKYYFGLNQPKSIRTKQPFMLGFEAGVRFHL